ncbi:peptidylprolyl isomerase, partial [Candidatus Latescibacterota bacterium]
IIVIVGFVGMIVLQWGMDIGSRQPGGTAFNVVGIINGTEVKRDLYENVYQSQIDMYGSQQRLTLDQIRMVHDEVWNYFITNILVEQEIEKRGITYSDQELLNYMMTNPLQGAEQIDIFKENDAFSIVKYQEFIANPQNLNDSQTRQYINMIETQAMNMIPRNKLLESLESSVIITDHKVREQWMFENEKRKIDYLFVNISTLQSYNADVSRDEAVAYYEENKEDYRQDEMRSLEGVFFSLSATAADSIDVLERAELLAERAQSGEDFAELADSYSEDAGNDGLDGSRNGGELGIFGRNQMTKLFEDVAFSMKPGEISDAFLTSYGYHIVKVDSVIYNEDNSEVEQVKASHILLKLEASPQTQDDISNRIMSFNESIAGGADFYELAQNDNLNIITTPLFLEDTMFIPNIDSNTKMLAKRAFSEKKGKVMQVYTTDSGYYIFRVAEIKKAGIPPFNEIQDRVHEDVKREMRKKYAEDYNTKILAKVNTGMSLDEAMEAVSDSLISVVVQTADVARNFNVPGLGMMNPLIARAFTLQNEGDTTGTVATDNGNGIAVLLEKLPLDESMYEDEISQIRTKLDSDMKNSVMNRYINQLAEDAEIIDDRHLFFSNL